MKSLPVCLLTLAAMAVTVVPADAECLKCLKSPHTCAVPITCAAPVTYAAPLTCAAPAVVAAPDCGCNAPMAAMSVGFGGVASLGTLYSVHMAGSFTGYEGLPNMNGGGVHRRLPYHSYRRPWAYPGPVSTHVSIVW